ncbi:MAG: hypothetical protein AMXMBFR34_49100 [Myxococcaceae bacterium]
MTLRLGWCLALGALAGCPQKKEPPPRATPRPLAPLEPVREADAGQSVEEDPLFRVVPMPPVGPKPPEGATVVTLDGEQALVGGAPLDLKTARPPLLLVPTEGTYLVQVAPLLAALDDAKVEVWLKHPEADIAWRLALRDEPTFQRWLEEPVPGKLRVIHRADGFELQTNMGKLHGADPNGPTVPVRGGKMDLATLRRGFERVQSRFTDAPDYCFMPSFGMELAQTARAMVANQLSATEAFFDGTCLVYPRPVADAGR